MMSAQRVILVNASRLLGDMLRRIIDRSDHLELVHEVKNDEVFIPHAIEKSDAEWVILSISSDKTFPTWVDPFLARHPSTRFLMIFPGRNKVRLKSLEFEEVLEDVSLKEMLYILEGNSEQV